MVLPVGPTGRTEVYASFSDVSIHGIGVFTYVTSIYTA